MPKIEALKTMNPSRLTLARKRRGLKKTELAKALGLNPRTITAYETGEHSASPEVAALLAAKLRFPIDFLYGEDLEEPNENAVSFRSITKLSSPKRDMALSQGALALHLTRWLEARFELPGADLPDLRHTSSPEAAAMSLRQMWGLGQMPVRNMIHLLEAKGVRVFSLCIDTREVDAFSMWKGSTPFVFLNCFKSSEHSRFDAAHELGHLVLHKHGAPNGREAEIDAHQFASAFLMPRGSVLAHAPRFPTIAELTRLKKIWLTSLSAVNQRLFELKLLTPWHHRTLCIEIAKRGFRTSEPEEAPRECSLVLPKLLKNLYDDDGMNRAEIAESLAIPLAELEQLLFGLVMTGIQGGGRAGGSSGKPHQLKRVK